MAPAYPADPVASIEQEAAIMEHEAGVLRVGPEVAPDFGSDLASLAKAQVSAGLPGQTIGKTLEATGPGSSSWLQLNHSAAIMNEPSSGATKLRRMLFETNELIVCPGVYDGLSARTALELGFNGLYMVCSFYTVHANSISDYTERRALERLHHVWDSLIWLLPNCMKCARMPR